MVLWNRYRSINGTGIGFVSGGEPIAGCDPVTLLITGTSTDQVEQRARELGVWDPAAWTEMRIRPREVERVLADPNGFLWKPGGERDWRASTSWPGAL